MKYIFLLILLSNFNSIAHVTKGEILFENNIKLHWTIKTFKEKKKRVFDWTRSYELTELTGKVAKETNADALTNVDFKIKHGFSDYLINVFTLGLAQSTTLEITGDAVKYDSNISTQK